MNTTLTTNRVNGNPAIAAQATSHQPAWLTILRDAISKKITPEVIEQAIQAQIDKALKGDQKALQFVLQLADRQTQAAPPVNATQNVFHVHLPAGGQVEDPSIVKIYSLLEAMGPMSGGQIAANVGLPPDDVDQKLSRHPWFSSVSRSGELIWSLKRVG